MAARELKPEELRIPVQPPYSGESGWRRLGLQSDPGAFYLLFVDLDLALLDRVRSHRMRYFLPNRRHDLY